MCAKIFIRIIFLSLVIVKAYATADVEVEVSPYGACENVKIISEEIYEKDKNKWQEEIRQCNGKIQVSPNNGFFIGSLQESLQQTQLLSFSKMVAERYGKNLETNLASLNEIANCFSDNAIKLSQACIDKREGVHQHLEKSTAELRGKLALVEADWNKKDSVDPMISKTKIVEILKSLTSNKESTGVENGLRSSDELQKQAREEAEAEWKKNVSKMSDTDIKNSTYLKAKHAAFVKMKLSKSHEGIATRKLDNDELDEAKSIVEKAHDKAEMEWKKKVSTMNEGDIRNPVYYKAQHEAFMKKKLWDFRRRAEEDYSKILYKEMPILAYLPEGNWDTGKKHFSWRNDKKNLINKALLQIMENAKKEKIITKKSLSNDKLELARIYERKEVEQVAANGQKIKVQTWALNLDKWVADIKGERDLASYIAFTPVVEEILTEHPEYCGVATGLSSHLNNKTTQNYAGVGAAMLPAFVAIGMIGTGAAVATGGAAAITGAEISSVLGIGVGMGFVKESLTDLKKAKRSVVTKSGTNDKEKDTGDYKTITEAENDVKFNALFHTIDYVGAGSAGKLFYSALKNKLIPKASIVAAHISPGEEAKVVNKALKEIIFNGRDPSVVELKTLDSLSETAKEKGFFGSEKMTLNEQRELMDRHILLTKGIFKASVKTEKDKLALMQAEELFKRLNPEAIAHWERGGFDGLLKVYNSALDEIKKMPAEKLAKLHNNSEEQFAIFDRALVKAGVKDKTERKQMAGCAFGGKNIVFENRTLEYVACR